MQLIETNSLQAFHTFGIELQAYKIIEANALEDFQIIWEQYPQHPKLILGQGSNLLFCENFKGVVILNRLKGIDVSETDEDYRLHVAGGENWHQLVHWCLSKQMPGLENLALIPGLSGSAPIQNIGAYGLEFEQRCEYVDYLDIRTWQQHRLPRDACEFGYRDSIFKQALKDQVIITAIGLRLPKQWTALLQYGPLKVLEEKTDLQPMDVFHRVCEIRQLKLPDPAQMGNAGSFFKNPLVTASEFSHLIQSYPEIPHYPQSDGRVKLAAGWLIESVGLKGHVIGGAAVHAEQALVLVNQNHATAEDVIALAQHVVSRVAEKFAVHLSHEVRFMGALEETCLEHVCQP